MNKHDSERVHGMLEALGALPVEEFEDADIVVFMTCCVREAADTRLYGQVASMKHTSLCARAPRSTSASSPSAAASGSATATSSSRRSLISISCSARTTSVLCPAARARRSTSRFAATSRCSTPPRRFRPTCPPTASVPWAAWLPITIGVQQLLHAPHRALRARAARESRPLEDIVAEAERCVDAGVQARSRSLGQNVNSVRARPATAPPASPNVLDAAATRPASSGSASPRATRRT